MAEKKNEEQEQEPTRWYNSKFGDGIGFAAIIAAFGFGGAALLRGCGDFAGPSKKQGVEMEKVRLQYKLRSQKAYINENEILDKFYVINGNIAVSELDGRKVVKPSLDESLEEVLEE